MNNDAIFDLCNVNLDSCLYLLYGPSGAGKSTFLRGLYYGHAEESIDGVNFKKLIDFNQNIQHVVYVDQHPTRLNLSVERFLIYAQKTYVELNGCPKKLNNIVDEFGLRPLLKQSLIGLSGGELHRVHLASAFSSEVDLLLLDEPTAALDKANTDIFKRLLENFLKNGGRVICCTHDERLRDFDSNGYYFSILDFPSFFPSRPIVSEIRFDV
ncbi:ATP-binding cassette domain-containing protein [Marinomonas transparens]|uniref:ATP-binding cassette domain-containing protein n=1 Tax=Marinomonas transparens TaxID=2795388 RepID=A0A934JZT7_9GAMM|nr:ATP-binding cassette domain-containing protein [Marinomonas transparens]MBJ7539907.1 ATP-binding cassette domain-containing protein [Marinomonas transparens]